MHTTHIVIGAKVGAYFKNIINQFDQFTGNLLVIEDDFSIGPLKDDLLGFSELRSSYWNALEKQSKHHIFNDLEYVVELSSALSKDEIKNAVLWVSPTAQDIISYYFLIFFLKKHIDKLQLISINGLPFLDDDLKLYFPTNFLDINTKGILKATKLARQLTYTEMELAVDEWLKLRSANSTLRVLAKMNSISCLSQNETLHFVLSKIPENAIKYSALLKLFNPISNSLKDLFFSSVLDSLVQSSFLSFQNNYYTKE